MTPAEERALIEATNLGLEEVLRDAYSKMRDKVLAGTDPRDAVNEAFESFNGQYSALLAQAFSAILAQSVSPEYPLDLRIGGLKLSEKLYFMRVGVTENVLGVVDRHLRGLEDARTLALDLFEGYGFRPTEPLVFNPRNDKLPRYLREALLPDSRTREEMARAFARLQVEGLSTLPLRAAYRDVLAAIKSIGTGVASDYLARKLEVAFYERMRYFANRIASTELHRAYMDSRAREILEDAQTEFVQYRLSSGHPVADICDVFAESNAFGLGAGIYPKNYAPVPPMHPWCLCVITPRPSLTGRKWNYDENADLKYFRSLDPKLAARVAGGKVKLERMLSGEGVLSVHNSGIDPLYQVKLAGDLRAPTNP